MKKIFSIAQWFVAPFASIFLKIDLAYAVLQPITQPAQVQDLFCTALLWMFWGLITLGIAMALVGGYGYATSSGEPEKVSKAGKTLMYAAIAIAVAIVAKGIPLLVGNFLGVAGAQLNACP